MGRNEATILSIRQIIRYYNNIPNIPKWMEENPRSSKELLLSILEKCKDALPEVATLMKRFDKIALQQPTIKIRQKDCLNPKFLLQLSQCGEQIRGVLGKALQSQRLDKELLKHYYRQYMEVVFAIRKYHEEAHLSHDLHKNSTAMKENLLAELKSETLKRKELEKELQYLRKELAERDSRIAELEAAGEHKDSRMNISQISQISKKVEVKYGQLYGGESRVGQLDEDEQTVEGRRLRKCILELEQQLEEKDQQLEERQQVIEEKEVEYERTVEELKAQILDLQTKFEEFYNANSNTLQQTKVETFKSFKSTSVNSRQSAVDNDEVVRFLLIQASTIEQYLRQGEGD